MAEPVENKATPPGPTAVLEQGTYEVIRNRLATHGADLKERLGRLNRARQEVFGAIQTALVATDRVTTSNKCTPRDMVAIGKHRFLFGYNVHVGLRSETVLKDVFALYEHRDHQFRELPQDLLAVPQFEADFKDLYRYYRQTVFSKFSVIGPHLFMVFRVGKTHDDIKTFKWLLQDESLVYLGNRSDHEFRYPPQHEFEWVRTHRELHRFGLHPHISIQDRVFVETVGGDLTIKIEDNTATGEGIYAEPVESKDQTLDDAEVYYASLGNLILLRIRPYQEDRFRYFVYNEKLHHVQRMDAIEDACVLLPDNQGIIFSSGYYLQTGEFKTFESAFSGIRFDGRLHSPNGEDHLYTFYHPASGNHVLLSYNVIEQRVELPLVCGGCSFFENGEMALFKVDDEPQKHHVIQIWQTPYVGSSHAVVARTNSRLYQIGNPELVSAMGECHEVLSLLGKQDTYANLYLDLVKQSDAILDSYFWLGEEESGNLRPALAEIRKAASAALEEFEKVVRIRRSTAEQVRRVTGKAREQIAGIPYTRLTEIGQFVQNLAELRSVRGELISLKELRYVDLPSVETVEQEVAAHIEKLAGLAIEFLLTESALTPYHTRVGEIQGRIPALTKGAEARKLDAEIAALAKDLEMLIEVVSNLKIEDATQTTRIIENISAIYSRLNQARATLKNRHKELQSGEAVAEFASQSRLLQQALVNYLDLCDSPAKCDEYVTRLMVQVEELEARFADFEEYVLQLAEKRTELSSAFETRKAELVEAHNKKTHGLLAAAERILKGIKHRLAQLSAVDAIHGYFASDLMVEKVRDLIRQLVELGDSVKADDLQSRLKTLREEAIRQLKDRQDLFVGGQNLIQFGKHRFSVNTQELDLTMVNRDGEMWLHLVGTRFFARVEDAEFLGTRPVWGQDVVSEDPQVYRGEYLAYRIFENLREQGRLAEVGQWPAAQQLAFVQEYMGPRYNEGYVKGVHDRDAATLLGALVEMHDRLDLLRYSTQARACARAFWQQFPEGPRKELLAGKVRGYGTLKQLFPSQQPPGSCVRELEQLILEFLSATGLFPKTVAADAADYLYHEIERGKPFVISPEAAALFSGFQTHVKARRYEESFAAARAAVKEHFASSFELLRDWVRGYASSPDQSGDGKGGDPASGTMEYVDEAAVLLLRGECLRSAIIDAAVARPLKPMIGSHPLIVNGAYELHFVRFMRKLHEFVRDVVPRFERCQALKKSLLERETEALRLEEFKPRVLTSFVRNRLIDSVYLPLVGNNLAKQIGVAGENKRTDLMGMLLLVSPPGYGKTTLMEYVANRLGIVFMKINGPAIGDKVVSLDPATAPNAAAREEVEKLNLALEMGDNVMIYLDDIQHCHPELLQKFISLCDAQRKIEGVYRGKSRTYDLRGRKVAVVMAGNPYTESGERFQIPDMLANRADTYNLGDIIRGSEEAFRLSYLENAMTSNPVLATVAARSARDIHPLIQLAQSGSRDGLEFEANYSPEELNQLTDVLRKLIRVRDVILKVNAEYIRSAAQAEAYRTEPPFRLQGSYRNMNRLAEQVLPIMNDREVEDLIHQHYQNEAQTLTKGAEANLLKFKELVGALTPAEEHRWNEIRRTFKKNLLLRSAGDGQDPVSLVVGQLSAFNEGLDSIKEVLAAGAAQRPKPVTVFLMPAAPPVPAAEERTAQPDKVAAPTAGSPAGEVPPKPPVTPPEEGVREVSITPETLKKIWDLVDQQNKH